MSEVASLVVPVFGLVLLGGLAGQSTVMAKNGRRVVDWLLLRLALPALVLQILANATAADLSDWPFFLTLTFGTYCAFAVAFTVSALQHGGDIRHAAIDGALGSHGSLVHLGPALVLPAFGAAAAVPLAVILLLDVLLIRLLLPTLWAIGGRERPPPREVLRRIYEVLSSQLIFPAAVIGGLFAVAGQGLPTGISDTVDLLASAAAPLGLISLGLALAAFRADDGREAKLKWTAPLATKLLIHPVIVYLLLSWTGDYPPEWVFAAMVLAALPSAAGMHALARGSTKPEPMDSTAATALVLSVVTLTILVALATQGVISSDPFY
jgi:predicted permease